MKLRNRCNPGRWVMSASRRIGRTASSSSIAKRPVPDRIARISKIVSVGASTRIATAIIQKVSSAPVIQKMTRTRGGRFTGSRPGQTAGSRRYAL